MGKRHVRALIVVALFANIAHAHEIGTTQVNALFLRNHTYRIDIITSPRALLTKLEAAAGVPRSPGDLPIGVMEQRLNNLKPLLVRSIDASFADGHAPLAVGRSPSAVDTNSGQRPTANGQRINGQRNCELEVHDFAVTIHLTGDIPRNARTFAWRYKLTYSTYSLALQNEGDPNVARQWLDGDQTSAPFPLSREVIPPTRMEVIRQYLALGFSHILPRGLDHILFVVGLCLLTRKMKQILAQVTAFTIAHSITLGLTIYGLVSLSPRIVEPLIALSIVYIAVENLTAKEMKPWRVALVFGFGLLHGMGFAGVLRDLGLPRSEFLTALVSFNLGVEGGQLSVIALTFVALAPKWRDHVTKPASALIAATGLFWTIQRLL